MSAAELLSLLSNRDRLLVLAEVVRHGDDGATLGELSVALAQPLAKIGDACARLHSAGAVTRMDGNRYVARLAGLHEAARALDDATPIAPLLAEYPKLRGLFSHGRLIAMPVLFSDGYFALAEMLARFVALDGPVDEAEVNARLSAVTDDVAKIRRLLVDMDWLKRDRAGTTYEPRTP
ncbi:MAG TPA: DUF2087 domain-containing protein [Micromonosporaceae bacterium]